MMILSVSTLSCSTASFKVQTKDPNKSIFSLTEDPSLEDVVRACDKALTDCKQANTDKQVVINAQDSELKAQQNAIDDLKKDQDSMWHKPVFTITFGAVLVLLIMIISGHSK